MWWVWVLVSLSSLVGLLILLLSVPVDLTFSLEMGKGLRSRVRIGWLFGLVGKDLGGNGRNLKPKKPKRPEGRRKKSPRQFLAMLKTRAFLGHSLKLARRLLRTIRVRGLEMDLKLGLGDPAKTGQLFGLLSPVLANIRSTSSFYINVEPDFQEEDLCGYCYGSVRAYPIRLVPPFILFALSLTTFQGVRAMLGARRR